MIKNFFKIKLFCQNKNKQIYNTKLIAYLNKIQKTKQKLSY